MQYQRSILAAAILAAVSLTTGCGGGSSARQATAPPPATPPPTTPPPVTPPPTRYTGRADNHIIPTNVDVAHAAGFTGAGVGIGILDSGANRSLASLQGAVASYTNYLSSDPASPFFGGDPAHDDPDGHGTIVAQLAAGRAAPGFRGGVAPGAALHVARICNHNGECFATFQHPATLDLLNRGVRIFNHSFGGGVWAADQDHQAALNLVLVPGALAANSLFVWGAGNSGAAQPTPPAALPHSFPFLARNWVSVVGALIDAQGNPVGLYDQSNRCGVSAPWCITAPYSSTVLPPGGFLAPSGLVSGTSISTAIVSGAAALVSQAFPWMGGDLLQLSLLTTTRDLGDPGVDPIFGWGLLDAGRAVRGPAQFAFGDVTANVNRAGSWTWAHNISGNGGLIKDGIGTLVLTGQNTYTGATSVNAGVLALNGGSVSSHVTTNAGGTFEARAATIRGSYTATAGSITGLQIGGPLTVTGQATLAGTAHLLAARTGHTIGGNETLLTAAGIGGTFGALTADPSLFFNGTLVYEPTRLSVNLVRKSAAEVTGSLGGGTAAIDGARHFDAALAQADAGHASRDFLQAASFLLTETSTPHALASMQSLSGEIHGTARNALFATSDQVHRAIGSRLDGLEGRNGGGWLSITSTRSDLEQSGFATAKTEGETLLAGVDGEFGRFTLGALIGTGKADASLGTTGGRFEADRSLVGLYGRTVVGQGYLLGSLSHEWLDVDTRRVGGTNVLTSNRDDRVWQARIEGGLNGAVSPYAALRFASYRQGAFTEAGGPLGFTARSDTHDAVYGELGLRYSHEFDFAGGDAWLTGHARYQRLLSNEDTAFRASFTGVHAAFLARGQELRQDMGLLGFTFGHRFADGWAWFADAEAEIASGGLTGHRVGFGVRGEF